MKLIKVFLFGLIGIILPVSLSAQTISGKLIDENSQPLPYANVVLLSLPDSAFVNGTISGEDGTFKLEATSENQIVKISSIGYKTVCKPVSPANIGIVQPLVSDRIAFLYEFILATVYYRRKFCSCRWYDFKHF